MIFFFKETIMFSRNTQPPKQWSFSFRHLVWSGRGRRHYTIRSSNRENIKKYILSENVYKCGGGINPLSPLKKTKFHSKQSMCLEIQEYAKTTFSFDVARMGIINKRVIYGGYPSKHAIKVPGRRARGHGY